MLTNKRILIIDDEINILNSLKRILEDESYSKFEIDTASQGEEAIRLVRDSVTAFKAYALAFVDINMPPGLDGIQTIKKIWRIDPEIQIVICTASSDYTWNAMIQELKKSDNFLILKKPYEVIEIRQLAFALTKKWQLNQQNRVYIENLENILKVRTKDLKDSELKLLKQSTHDMLTGLPNRALLLDRVSQVINAANLNAASVAIYFIDINNFQLINESYGFQLGDSLLQSVANRLSKLINLDMTTLARWGSDTFVMVHVANESAEYFSLYADKLAEIINQSYEIDKKYIMITASIGISIYPSHTRDPNHLLKYANTAVDVAKNNGHNNKQLFEPEFCKTALKRVKIENMLYHAIENNEFSFMYYPVYDLMTNQILGIETSLIWHNRLKGVISPNDYIAIAEEIGILPAIGEWMLREIGQKIHTWAEKQVYIKRVSLRIHKAFFLKDNFVDIIDQILKETATDPSLIEFEISGDALIAKNSNALEKLIQLRNIGIHIALSDFGNWHESLNNISIYPFEKVKINKQFIQELDAGEDLASIVRTIITLAKNLNLEVIAEGVETYSQINFLRHNANNIVRGYVLQKPLNQEACLEILRHQ